MGKEITKSIEQEEWYNSLIEDCQSILTEGIWNYKLTLIKTYHLLGKRILEENDNFKRKKVYGEKIVSQVSQSLKQGNRTIWRAIQFARQYPDLDLLPEGKNISWHKICNELLPKIKNNKEERHYMTVLIDKEKKVIWLKEKYKDYKIIFGEYV